MPLFEWNEKYSVNVGELDEQHRKLIEMINDVNGSITAGNGKAVVKPVLDKLLDYTAYHFVTEERFLEAHRYPDLTKHKSDHNTLLWQVLDLRSRYEAGEDVEASEVLDFLTDWLKSHLLSSDKKYAAFLNSQGML